MRPRALSADIILLGWLRKTYRFTSGVKIKFQSYESRWLLTQSSATWGTIWTHHISIEESYGLMISPNGATSYPSHHFNVISWDGGLRFKEIWGNRIHNIGDPKFFTRIEKHITRVLIDKCDSFVGKK